MLTFMQFVQLQEGKLNLTRKDLRDRVIKIGWTPADNSGRGDHEKFIHPESRLQLSIPRSKTLSPKVIANTLRDSVRHEKDENVRRVA